MMVSQFAIVGHANKGKSSLVATLAQNDAIAVSEVSGTTTQIQTIDFRLGGEVCYQLIDTPGFQRARVLLETLKKQVAAVADRRKALEAFLETPENGQRFPDEFQLLRPILEGAAVIYVVDGATPYSVDYEPEMELLQWTGQPRMAVINPIGNADFVDDWQQVLDQYFSTVRVFDPLQSDFNAQIDLLQLFSTLRTEWKPSLDSVIQGLKSQRQRKIQQAARIILEQTEVLLSHEVMAESSEDALGKLSAQLKPSTLIAQYQQDLRSKEQAIWDALSALFVHANLTTNIEAIGLQQDDLFNSHSWQMWGLPRKTVISLAMGTGAAAGVAIDVAVGGTSLMMGALLGSAAAGISTTLFGEKISKTTVGGLFALGKQTEQVGPVKNLMFSWAIFGRQIAFATGLLHRNHARRDTFHIGSGQSVSADIHNALVALSKSEQLLVSTWLVSRGKRGNPDKLLGIIETLIANGRG